jgi:hypothetical protein
MSESTPTTVLTEPVEPATPVRQPHVEFYAEDRFHAATHVKSLAGLARDTGTSILAVLEKLTHTGPVHVLIAPGTADSAHVDEGPDEAELHATDKFVVRPFTFVQV